MARTDWSWRPGKQAPRKKIEGTPRVEGSPRSTVPHVEQKTEKAMTGGWGSGPGNNVSATSCGVNAAQFQMATHMDTKFGDEFKARRAARKANKAMAGKRKVDVPNILGPWPAPKDRDGFVRIPPGTMDVALRPWQEHALSRLKTKR